MSHNKHPVRVGRSAADRVGNNAHSHLADLFGCSGCSAKEGVAVVLYHGNLVAAAAESHFKSLARVKLAFLYHL